MRYILLLTALIITPLLHAQKVLQLEKYGKAKTKKIFIGEKISYQLEASDTWHTATIEDLMIEQNKIVLHDRYVDLEKIVALRFFNGGAKVAGTSLVTFGLGWSLFALGGSIANPDFSYRWSDAAVTGTSVALGLIIPKLFSWKKFKIGKKKRLRLLDLSFYEFDSNFPNGAQPVP